MKLSTSDVSTHSSPWEPPTTVPLMLTLARGICLVWAGCLLTVSWLQVTHSGSPGIETLCSLAVTTGPIQAPAPLSPLVRAPGLPMPLGLQTQHPASGRLLWWCVAVTHRGVASHTQSLVALHILVSGRGLPLSMITRVGRRAGDSS